MFEIISETYSAHSDWINGSASTLTILGVVWAAINFVRRSRSKLVFCLITEEIYPRREMQHFSVSITGNGVEGGALYRTRGLISNRTRSTITDHDFIDLPHINKEDDGIVYSMEIQGRGEFIEKKSPSKISFGNLKIKRDDGLIFIIFHDGCVSEKVVADSKSIDFSNYSEISVPYQKFIPAIAMTVLFLLAFLSAEIWSLFDTSGVPSLLKKFLVLLNLIAIISVLILMADLIDKYLAPVLNKLFGLREIEKKFLEQA